jgi:hypothetical protein
MRHIKLMLIMVLAAFSLFSQDNNQLQTLPQKYISAYSAKKDLALLRDILYAVHPGQFMHCSKTEFENCYDSLANGIPHEVSISEFYKRVCALLSLIKDGHTQVDKFPVLKLLDNRMVFPFGVYIIDDNLFIGKTLIKDRDSFQGKEVLSINGRSSKDLISQIRKYISIEGLNISALNHELNFFPFYYSLIDTSETFQLNYKNDNGVIGDTILYGLNINTYRAGTRKIVPPISAEFRADRIAILTVNTFSMDDFNYKKIDYKKYIKHFFKQLERINFEKLIIDVRGNGGGSAEIANYLFSYLSHEPYNYFESIGKKKFDSQKWKNLDLHPEFLNNVDTFHTVLRNGLYYEIDTDGKNYWWFEKQKPQNKPFNGEVIVLADGGSFSTTGHFVALFREHNIGKIYGECTHGSYYSNDGSHTFRLPNTGIRVSIPTAQFKISVKEFKYDPKGICPDVEVNKTHDDIKTGFDSSLQFVIKKFR